MRDTNDMMEDAICEDTMMECSSGDGGGGGGGGGLEDLVNLASDIADSAPSIRDAAERLLTLLGVDEDDDASSSEDEGVEVDLEDSDSEEPQDTRLLHQLAASLAQELKYAKQNSSNTKLLAQSQNVQSMEFGSSEANHQSNNVQSMRNLTRIHLLENSNNLDSYSSGRFYPNEDNDEDYEIQLQSSHVPRYPPPPPYNHSRSSNSSQFDNLSRIHSNEKNLPFGSSNFINYNTVTQVPSQKGILTSYDSSSSSSSSSSSPSIFDSYNNRIEDSEDIRLTDPVSWGVGWDACASEALRYLVEDEGLPPHHPTVVAMKNHLDLQRSRVVSQFAS